MIHSANIVIISSFFKEKVTAPVFHKKNHKVSESSTCIKTCLFMQITKDCSVISFAVNAVFIRIFFPGRHYKAQLVFSRLIIQNLQTNEHPGNWWLSRALTLPFLIYWRV